MTDATTIVFHLGAPMLNMDQLTASLRKDNELLIEHSAMVRRPRRYRTDIHNRLMELEIEGKAAEDAGQLLTRLCAQQEIDRLLLSDGTFLGPLEEVFSAEGFYPSALEQIRQLVELFPDNSCEFLLEIRNPVTFLPEVAGMLGEGNTSNLLNKVSLDDFRWSDVIADIRWAAPESPITIWRHEDNPFIWPEVLRAVSGIGSDVDMQGDLDQAFFALPVKVSEKMVAYIAAHPELSFRERRYVITSFLDAAKSHQSNVTPQMEKTELEEKLCKIYSSDFHEIKSIVGVKVLE